MCSCLFEEPLIFFAVKRDQCDSAIFRERMHVKLAGTVNDESFVLRESLGNRKFLLFSLF